MTTQAREPPDREVEAATMVLPLLSDPTRLRIVQALLHGEHAVNELADHVGAQPAAVSLHLAKLRSAALVRTQRVGSQIFYAAENEHIRLLAAEAMFHAG